MWASEYQQIITTIIIIIVSSAKPCICKASHIPYTIHLVLRCWIIHLTIQQQINSRMWYFSGYHNTAKHLWLHMCDAQCAMTVECTYAIDFEATILLCEFPDKHCFKWGLNKVYKSQQQQHVAQRSSPFIWSCE